MTIFRFRKYVKLDITMDLYIVYFLHGMLYTRGIFERVNYVGVDSRYL